MRFLAALALLAALIASPGAQAQAQAQAQALVDRCEAATCKARLTADQLLAEVQALIAAKRFDEARPMLAALEAVPAMALERRFLTGMVAAAEGDHAAAARQYKAILSDDPSQTRVRLELARAMLAMGRTASADRQFRMAQQAEDLPPDIARTIRAVRDVIRARRAWRLDIDLGIAPDTNINGATSATTVDILWGGTTLPLTLDDQARARSGLGQTATISAGVRLPVAKHASLLVDLDAGGTNYAGETYDDYQLQLATGPELRLSLTTSISVQAVGAQRWYGGRLASRQSGIKAGFQAILSDRDRIGLQLDARRTDARFDAAYGGWQSAAYATYERAVRRSLVASTGVFARRDWLKAPAYSSVELGAIAGIGGELPFGINFGVSGTASRATFDAPVPIFSLQPRRDWRFMARATLGNRKIRVLGFSPQIGVTWTRNDSSIGYYSSDRVRFKIAVARYF